MFDFSQIIELLRVEPGHGMLQSILLFMIWMQSRGLRKEIAGFRSDLAGLKDALYLVRTQTEVRFQKVEDRLTVLEGGKKNG